MAILNWPSLKSRFGPNSKGEDRTLNEVVPKLSRVTVLRHTGRGGVETAAIETAARTLGMTVLFTDVRIASDLAGAFVTMTQGRAGSFVILGGRYSQSRASHMDTPIMRPRYAGGTERREVHHGRIQA